MINKFDLIHIMGPLAKYIGRPLDDDLVDIYVSALRHYDDADLRRAVTYLLESWTSATFPRIAHIKDAIADTATGESYAMPDDLDEPCDVCNGGGHYSGPDEGQQEKEIFCTCRRGRDMRAARTRWFRRRLVGGGKSQHGGES